MKKYNGIIVSALLLSSFLLAGTAFGLSTGTSKSTPSATDPLNVQKGTIVSNLFFGEQSLSGLTMEEAKELVMEPLEKMVNCSYRITSKTDSTQVVSASASNLGIDYDEESVNKGLDEAVLSGSLLTRYKKAKDYQKNPVLVDPQISYSESKINNFFGPYMNKWKSEPVDASVECSNDGSLTVIKGHNGCSYSLGDSVSILIEDLLNYRITGKQYDLQLSVEETEADLTNERAATFTIIGEYTTEYSFPTTQVLENRQQNLISSTSHMNGYRFAPGETASALTMYGDIKYENGYLPAGTFIDGGHSDELGGGICQTTTTLYNAVLMAELDIAYRNHHSMLVTYVTPSRDAMVYAAEGNDFKFVNSSSDYIFINSFVDTETATITVRIIGHEDHPADHSVNYESEILGYQLPSFNIIYDDTMDIGWTDRTKFSLGADAPLCGLQSRLWKISTDGGVETKTIVNEYDSYKPFNAGSYVVSRDLTVRLEIGENIYQGFVEPVFSYLVEDVYVSSDPTTWTPEEVLDFNTRMKEACKAVNIEWPDDYARVSRVDEDGNRNLWFDRTSQLANPPVTESASDSSSTTSGSTNASSTTGTTSASSTTTTTTTTTATP